MFVTILHFLGVTPGGGKTGKREAAWMFTGITLLLTAVAMLAGVDMVTAMQPILIGMWTASAGLLGVAYGLEWKAQQAPSAPEVPAVDPLGGIAVPDGAVG